MRRDTLTTVTALVLVAGSAFGSPRPTSKPTSTANSPQARSGNSDTKRWLIGQAQFGYYGGVGFHGSLTATDFAEGFPFSARLGLGYAKVNSGDEWAARRIFIDNNQNGDARSDARVWDLRLDVLYPVKVMDLRRTNVYGGIRRTDFEAFFEYIGGAETFSVRSHQWGLGGGLETAFAINPRLDLVFSLGADYYFKGTLDGHDTYYRPDNDNTNPIASYTYADADKAINQPDVMTRIMLGWAYRF